MKTKQVILGIVAASTLLILFLIVAIFNIYDDKLSFQFLNKYEVEQRDPWTTKTHTGENITYIIKADYDTFIEAAKTELLAKGFSDVTDPNKEYSRQEYEKDAFEDVRVEIYFAIVRTGFAINKPLYGPLEIKVHRIKPKLSIHNFWNYLNREYMIIKSKMKHRKGR